MSAAPSSACSAARPCRSEVRRRPGMAALPSCRRMHMGRTFEGRTPTLRSCPVPLRLTRAPSLQHALPNAAGGRDGAPPSEEERRRVAAILAEPDAPSYWFAASRDGNREVHYRGLHLGATLMHPLLQGAAAAGDAGGHAGGVGARRHRGARWRRIALHACIPWACHFVSSIQPPLPKDPCHCPPFARRRAAGAGGHALGGRRRRPTAAACGGGRVPPPSGRRAARHVLLVQRRVAARHAAGPHQLMAGRARGARPEAAAGRRAATSLHASPGCPNSHVTSCYRNCGPKRSKAENTC